MHFIDQDNGWAVGGKVTGGKSIILHTSDGGSNWEEQDSGPDIRIINSVCFSDQENGWAVGGRQNSGSFYGRIIHTDDGGITWTQQQCNTSHYLADVTFVDSINGWAVGRNGDILSTSDGASVNRQVAF